MTLIGSRGRVQLQRILDLRHGVTNLVNTTIPAESQRQAIEMCGPRSMPLPTRCSCARWPDHRSNLGACASCEQRADAARLSPLPANSPFCFTVCGSMAVNSVRNILEVQHEQVTIQ